MAETQLLQKTATVYWLSFKCTHVIYVSWLVTV